MNPLAVIAAIEAVAKAVAAISAAIGQGANAELGKIDAELQQMQAQLDVIGQQLDAVLTALAQLSVKISAEFDSLYRVPVHTAIEEVNQHFKTWATNWNPDHNPAVPKPQDVLEKLHSASLSLMQRDAYANYSTVAVAMVYERALLRLPPPCIMPTQPTNVEGLRYILNTSNELRIPVSQKV